MQRIQPDQPHPLFDTATTRRLEAEGIAATGEHVLMQRAGRAVAQLARALAPHARHIWIACGAGNNGGDGLEAAALLQTAGCKVSVTWLGSPETASSDTRQAWQRATAANVHFTSAPPDDLGSQDLCIDALLGIGLTANDSGRKPSAAMLDLLHALRESPATLLCVDLPSGLIADTGQLAPGFAYRASPPNVGARHTLSLLTLHPGLFTGAGRDEAGAIWFSALGLPAPAMAPSFQLSGAPSSMQRPHASHKGSWGDVAIIGGQGVREGGMGMTGAAVLAASAALHAGAGRVMLAPHDPDLLQVPGDLPEIMLRRFEALELERMTVVCGCGGGTAVRALLPDILRRAQRLVLDADALNAIAADASLQARTRERAQRARQPTVITPHPLEAARLLGNGMTAADVQSDRLAAAQRLAQHLDCVVVLKGSGTVIAAPDCAPHINPTGNARLATGGTGDVLAGLLGARMAAFADDEYGTANALQVAIQACWQHGSVADRWPEDLALTASQLAKALTPG